MEGSNAESLHDTAKGAGKRTGPEFLNPGTSPTPFVSKEQRRSGKIVGAQVENLKNRTMNPNNV